MLRRGQLSFALFGHPYEWEDGGAVSWVRVWYPEAVLSAMPSRPIHDPQVLGGDLARAHRAVFHSASFAGRAGGWAYQLREDGTSINDGQDTQDTVSFQPNIASTSTTTNTGSPGATDVPAGTRFPRETGDGRRGVWLEPGTEQLLLFTGDEINPVTGRKYRADADWQGTRSDIVLITGTHNPVRYRRGYPDFSPWEVGIGSATLRPLMRGNYTTDFANADKQLAVWLQAQPGAPANFFVENGNPVAARAQAWRNTYTVPHPDTGVAELRPLTWHHHQDMRTMQLVPSRLNSPIAQHDGGAPLAEVARW